MAKLNSTASDKQKDALESTSQLMSSISVTTDPVVITAVQRKANIGNYETIDLYVGVAIPLTHVDLTDPADLEKCLNEAIDRGFSITASATAERYHKIKNSLK